MTDVADFLKQKYPDNNKVCEGLISLYNDFSSWGVKDSTFDQSLTDNDPNRFHSRVWEMVLARHLKNLGFDIKSEDAGPDFLFEQDGQRIWVEAVCPTPVGLSQQWLNPFELDDGPHVSSIPHEQMLLRWTSVLKEKNDKLIGTNSKAGYIQKGIVKENDAYVVAISSSQLGMGLLTYLGISQFPMAVEAVFPIGPNQVVIDRETMEVSDINHQHRPAIIKPSTGAEINTGNFLDQNYNRVSAIIGTNAGLDAACGCEWPICVVHNPNASSSAPKEVWGARDEYFATDMGDFFRLDRYT
ncbi:hypothetical protein [Ahrensia marina]|uniref:Uncharacterized protein n=1 Tax=Ahrensia marina TaxID=1514904 RepID=A0A0N0VLP1_9HYPH|nr:hypothetical protein [Ahrensia marina]KPB01074.1 hypothetical protein SU32_10590 [Ahrensia marina]